MTAKKILIADDDDQLLKLLCIQLKHAGYEVICARDGYQALEYARREEPDVLVLDVNMPAGDGFSVQERIMKMTDIAMTPVIYITGEQSDRVKINSAAFGAAAVIQKPFEVEDVVSAIEMALAA